MIIKIKKIITILIKKTYKICIFILTNICFKHEFINLKSMTYHLISSYIKSVEDVHIAPFVHFINVQIFRKLNYQLCVVRIYEAFSFTKTSSTYPNIHQLLLNCEEILVV